MIKKIILALVGLLCIGGLLLVVTRKQDEIDPGLVVQNDTGKNFEAVGIMVEDKAVLNKSNGEDFYIPEELLKGLDEFSLVAINDSGQAWTSPAVNPDGKKVTIKNMDGGQLHTNQKEIEKFDDPLDIPNLNEWQIYTEGDTIHGSFDAKTDLAYTLYILGKGGKLGISDTQSGQKVEASWEKPDDKLDSWLVFSKA
ncbi:Uncharacterised protein [Alloiococcus otitis]|uniref:Uncharacterized protein n=1 Tax=Alloiococcus otitis ATCC 51267 TaxID=883081 RepID=K9E7L7_9LACT|nr:hypothetical protein [Alloiococcus otitis]EKU93199.1 hypothetical protein HMPREF9698_01360 [Alloiococcus otitis ATCC 51267]SUU80537.1 Uncharacterised protein [Alloiococcus otitis]